MSQPPREIDPYERYRVEALERDRKEKQEWKNSYEENRSATAFGALLLFLFRKFLQLFQETTEKGLTLTAEKEMEQNLLAFKESLETLKREDPSQDSAFLNRLSTQWHQLLDDVLKFQKSTPFANQYISLIKEIETYPEKTEHNLGYYLMEYAGHEWLPFPFMELIQNLHLDHEKHFHESLLTRWTNQIDSLLVTFED